ncbi:hypothetical protein IFM89_006317 [Coptis chinensis]|uniref:Uncharacterized protein n=1 Tax=Coptis chinensis TaxID=261450 RepID=A0A835I8H9_9MAGN|nr:hypothetical protein IFM89_006317 [Coptis chinensis]
MASLQRSTSTYRRHGSSGLVWERSYLSGNFNQGIESRDMRTCRSVGSVRMMEMKTEVEMEHGDDLNVGCGFKAKIVLPATDPTSSIKVFSCGLWKLFSESVNSKGPKNGKHKY